MNPRVKEVYPNQNHTVLLVFDNGEERLFDVSPYLEKGIFTELKDQTYFQTARTVMGTVCWQNGQDFCPDTLYLESTPHKSGQLQAVAETPPDYGIGKDESSDTVP
ncbi:MAG: DUF2442 domain-containing protein [Kiritimatiellales bacterium]|nr:DUF2442 domain-containing protein [Kiritimatiellales bacterium]